MTKQLMALFLRTMTGVSAQWRGCGPNLRQRIYFANHASHLDAPTLWAALPAPLREVTFAVAARDYWSAGPFRQFLAQNLFNALLIERKSPTARDNPIEDMLAAMGEQYSLILFPEGGRGTEVDPGPFKPGLFHLARKRPDIELVPVLLDNLNRILPKGEVLPAPLIASAVFGAPVKLEQGESKQDFLCRARQSVLDLRLT